jgi:hypothetical protein
MSHYAPKEETLLVKVRELLKDQDLMLLYAETRISFGWLQRVKNGHIKDPGVNRIQWLYEHLTKTKLIPD